MKDILSHKTAVRLKETGFPQPEPEAGQMWYYTRFPDGTAKKNVLCILAHEYPYQDNLEALPLDGGERICNPRNTQIFAPTAVDILRELSSDCVLGTKTLGGWICGSWRLISSDHMKFFVGGMHDKNPAEAAAETWLKLNEK